MLIETLVSVVTGVVVGVGLGAWFPINSVAGRVMAGSILAPLLLLGLNIATAIPLSYIALAVYGLSLIGLIKFSRSIRGGEMSRILVNPVFVLPLIFLLLLFTINPVGYQSFEWDEFASWLYWGKELYLADGLNAGDLSWRQLGYPQAWPVALAFPQLLYSQFDPMRSLAVGVIWHAATVGVIYEIIATYLRRKEWASPRVVILVGYLLIFLLLGAEALRKLVPQDFLIELPQIFLLSSVFALFCHAVLGAERLRGLSLTVGIMLAAGLMVKISVIAAVPAAAAMVIYISLANNPAAARNQRFADTALNLGLFLMPIALVQAAWIFHAGQFQTDLSKLDISFNYSADHLSLLLRLGDAARVYIGTWKMPLTVISVIGLAYAAAKREFRPVVVGLLIFLILYSAGLFQLYAFRFGPVEVAELQSHQRYLRVPLRIMHILGIVFLFILAVTDLMGSRFDIKRYFSERNIIRMTVLAVAVFGGLQIYVVRQSLVDVRDRYTLSKERLGVIIDLQSDRKALEPILKKFGELKPVIALIAQGDDGYSLRVVRFLALSNRKGEDRIKYRLLNGFAWSEHPDDKKGQTITALKLTDILREADIIWGHRRDAWIDGIFKNFTVGCQRNASWRFLVKQGADNDYICIP